MNRHKVLRWFLAVAVLLLVLVLGYLLSGAAGVWPVVLGFGMIFFTGVAIGRLADTRIGGLTAYVIGLAIVALCGLALLLPQWPEIYRTWAAARASRAWC